MNIKIEELEDEASNNSYCPKQKLSIPRKQRSNLDPVLKL